LVLFRLSVLPCGPKSAGLERRACLSLSLLKFELELDA
jgi:hypothetical protein